jgi:hypothetical protein
MVVPLLAKKGIIDVGLNEMDGWMYILPRQHPTKDVLSITLDVIVVARYHSSNDQKFCKQGN